MEIRNSQFMHARRQTELGKMFGPVPGVDMSLPLLGLAEEAEERQKLANTGSGMIFDNVFKPTE